MKEKTKKKDKTFIIITGDFVMKILNFIIIFHLLKKSVSLWKSMDGLKWSKTFDCL